MPKKEAGAIAKKRIEEEKRRHDEEERRNIQNQRQQLLEEGAILKQKLSLIPNEKANLEKNRAQINIKKENYEKEIQPILVEERLIEKKEHELEEESRKTSGARDRRDIQEKLWGVSDERRSIEEIRWQHDQKLLLNTKEAQDIELKIYNLNKELGDVNGRLKAIGDEFLLLDKKEEKLFLGQRLLDLADSKEKMELEWVVINEKKRRVDEKLKPFLQKESGLQKDKDMAEKKEGATLAPKEKHDAEELRWRIDRELRFLQEGKWELEVEQEEHMLALSDLKKKYRAALAEEKRLDQVALE